MGKINFKSRRRLFLETLEIPGHTIFNLLESFANKGYGGVMSQEFKTVAILKAQLSRGL